MRISRREVAWAVATVPVALALVAIAFATSWPVTVFIVGIVCWIAVIVIFCD